MSAQPKPFVTPQEYLLRERLAEFRSEYHNGEILAMDRDVVGMAGGSVPHSFIKENFIFALRKRFEGGPCKTMSSDMKVRIPETNSYVYPDIIVICDKAQVEEDHKDVLTNPKIVVEVLSPSTESYDRWAKFDMYRTVSSLQEYILVSQKQPHCYRFVRLDDGSWNMNAFSGLESSLQFGTVSVALPLTEIYHDIEFEA